MSGRGILVIHPGALGDVLQAVPALSALRALDGGSRVSFAGQPRLARLLAGAGAVDAELPFDGLGLEHLFADDTVPEQVRVRLGRFERVVSWFGARATPYPDRLRSLVAPGSAAKAAEVAIIAPPMPDASSPLTVWEHLLATLSPWGVRGSADQATLAPAAEWLAAAAATLTRLGAQPGRPLVVVHPGAGGAGKRWPVDKHASVVSTVAARTGCHVLVHQGPADEAPACDLRLALEGLGIAPLTLLEPELGPLAGVLRAATAYLGADSGVSHLAAAVGAPAVILFSTEMRRQWAPWSPTARLLVTTPDGRDAEEAAALLVSLTRCA